MKFIEYIELFNTFSAPISFFIGLFTFFTAKKVNQKITEAIKRRSFREKHSELKQIINGFIDNLREDPNPDFKVLASILNFTSSASSQFPEIERDIQPNVEEIKRLIISIRNPSTHDSVNELVINLISQLSNIQGIYNRKVDELEQSD